MDDFVEKLFLLVICIAILCLKAYTRLMKIENIMLNNNIQAEYNADKPITSWNMLLTPLRAGYFVVSGKLIAFADVTSSTPTPGPVPTRDSSDGHSSDTTHGEDPKPSAKPVQEPAESPAPLTPTPTTKPALPTPAPSSPAPTAEPTPTTPIPSPTPTTEPVSPTPTPTAKPATEDNLTGERIVDPYKVYSYDDMVTNLKKISDMYPDFTSMGSIGESVKGKDLPYIALGTGSIKIILVGSHHGREYISTTFLMKMLDEYAYCYANDMEFGNYKVKELLDKVTIYIVPMLNPDGVQIVQDGTDRTWKSNANGVDLNRNYPAQWEEGAILPRGKMGYKGPYAASEPEVRAMIDFSLMHDFQLAGSYHTKGELLYWADSGTVGMIPEAEGIANRFCKLTGYYKMPVSSDPSVYAGGYENWFRRQFSRPGFCIELTPTNDSELPHKDKDFDKLVWKKAKYTGLFFAQEAINLANSNNDIK